ncbi:MAG: biopolymer transporter ExbD [Verrucomicrobiota bacterium]|jgi:biopolymer transport protein ExbD|nr:biopolymer transporter ExbD [Verrucomicrobiota bacterium]MDP7048562.1 biopolymer transporter ExbD [Verrucomicrobiota bacterium]
MILRRKTFEATVPSMAMGDIAFLLLIFIVLLARARDESHLVWQPATGTELVKPANRNASVVIDKQNVTYLNGRAIPVESLGAELESLLGDLPAGGRTVLFKVHKDVIAEFFEPAIEAVSEAGGELHHVLEPASNRTLAP